MVEKCQFFYGFITVLFLYFSASAQDLTARSQNSSQRLIETDSTTTIIVTATRTKQASQWVSDDHSVVNVEKLLQGSSRSITEMLSSQIPAQIQDYGGGGTKNISLRGAGSERTLVLVDGKRIGLNQNDLGDIPPEIIEKIEMVEGGQSAIYGLDAIGGVVNIITKQSKSDKPISNLSVTLSSYEPGNGRPHLNGTDYNFSTSRQIEHLQWISGANWQLSDGKYEYLDLNNNSRLRTPNNHSDMGLFQKLQFKEKNLDLGISASYNDRMIDMPGSLTHPSLASMKKKIGFISLNGGWTAGKYLKLKLNASGEFDSVHYADPDISYPQDSKHFSANQDIEFIQEFICGKQEINTGVDLFRQSIQSNELGDHIAQQRGVFANAVLEKSYSSFVFVATPAVRYDYSTLFNSTVNGKLGLISTWQTLLRPSAFVNVGQSFHNPTFYDLYWPYMGNPDLKKENSRDIDCGLQIRHTDNRTDFSGRVSYFAVQFSDMIMWQPYDSGHVWLLENVPKASLNGCKLDLRCSFLHDLNGNLSFSYNNARNQTLDKFLIYRPKYIIASSIQRSGARLIAGVSFRYGSSVFTEALNQKTLPANAIYNFNIGYKLFSAGSDENGLRLVYDALNVTNQKQCTNEGYPLPGREHRVSLKMNF
jgi:vitamin B12 transporter